MKTTEFTCDSCGAVLERHGKRYTVAISRVPALRDASRCVFDLCPTCATEMKVRLGHRYTEVNGAKSD